VRLFKLLNRSFLPAMLFFLALGSAAAGAKSPYPILGKLIDVGGYRVHLYCIGEGSPTVFIVGGFSFDWDLVQPSIAKITKVCTYDVSGTAWSDPGPSLTCSERVSEIHKLVKSAGIERPFIFVGFSIGALVGRTYASLDPDEIAGMVMVDHAFLPFGGDAPADPHAPAVPGVDSPPVLIYKTPIVLTVEEASDFGKLPKRIQDLHRWATLLKPVLATAETAKECLSILEGAAQNPHPLDKLPLVVISTRNDAAGYEKLQNELLSLSLNSKQLIAERSFHSVEIDEPEIVISGIRQVVEAVRARAAITIPPSPIGLTAR
jgi:pimeloyl-ACP methyl ester carboxylesterase